MHSPKRIKITDVNPHLICVLCGGYYVDASTVIECLHSFCKTCIVKYLEKNKYCPICDVLIHKTSPLLNVRPDRTLQNVVYKLVPSLFKNEMQRRSEFYKKLPHSLPLDADQRGEITENTPIIIPEEILSICLEYDCAQNPTSEACKRYLNCPAIVTVGHLVKLIRGKYGLNSKHQVHIYFKDDNLQEQLTLMDVAYIYQCRRKVPINLTYKIYELRTKRIRIINPRRDPVEEKTEEKEWKEVQLQISENGVMSVRNVESYECSPIPAVEAPPVYSPSMTSSCSNNVDSSAAATSSDNVTSQTPEASLQQVSEDANTPMETEHSGEGPNTKNRDEENPSSCIPPTPPSVVTSSSESAVVPSPQPAVANSLPDIASSINCAVFTSSDSIMSDSSKPDMSGRAHYSVAVSTNHAFAGINCSSDSSIPSVTSVSSSVTTSLPSVPVASSTSSIESQMNVQTTDSLAISNSGQMLSMRASPGMVTIPYSVTSQDNILTSSSFKQVPKLIPSSNPLSVSSVAARLNSGEVTVTPALSTISTAIVTSSFSQPIPSVIPFVSNAPQIISQQLAPKVASPALSNAIYSSFSLTPPRSPSLPSTSPMSIPSPTISQSLALHPPAPLSHSFPVSSVSTAAYSLPSLPPYSSMSMAHHNTISSSQSSESSIVTTMAGMKSQTNLLPTNYPIMSASRPQTEPIVSVCKVSKDQVRKPNNFVEANKLSISRVSPSGMKEKGENLNKIVNKLSPNERVIGNTSVTIRPVINNPVSNLNSPKMFSPARPPGMQSPPVATASKEKQTQAKYKTLKSPTKQWNPSIDRATMLMKQTPDPNKPSRFFKMRNMPRFLGNPSSGVKPMYACPEEQQPPTNQSKQHQQKLTLMKVDPKTIPTSSIPRSPTKQPPPYTPGSPKMNKPPPAYPDPKPNYLNPTRLPSPAHAGNALGFPTNPYHLLYSGYSGFSPDANRMLSPELIRSMCAFHPSLTPSLGMLYNPSLHPALPRPQENFKPEPPSIQRIPSSKNEAPSPKPQSEERRYPSPVSTNDQKKQAQTLTPPPQPAPPSSPKISEKGKEAEKPAAPSEPPPPPLPPPPAPAPPPAPEVTEKSPPSASETPRPPLDTEVKENHLDKTSEIKENMSDTTLNCDPVNVNNNNQPKEEPVPSQPSEGISANPQ